MVKKTIVPGMDEGITLNQPGGWHSVSNPYARETRPTRVDGIDDNQRHHQPPQPEKAFCQERVICGEVSQKAKRTKAGKPILGFVFSVSRVGTGEFWPLYQGPNSIGRSTECDICLREATVSQNHANLLVRVNKNPKKLVASIQDIGSTVGTMLNGESLEINPRECFNGDHIVIGDNYELYLILLDTEKLDLHAPASFIPVEDEIEDNVIMPGIESESTDTIPGGFPPYFAADRYEASLTQDGTVGLDGQVGPRSSGETVGL